MRALSCHQSDAVKISDSKAASQQQCINTA